MPFYDYKNNILYLNKSTKITFREQSRGKSVTKGSSKPPSGSQPTNPQRALGSSRFLLWHGHSRGNAEDTGVQQGCGSPGGPKEAGLGAPGAEGASPGAAPLLPPAGAAAAVPGAAAASPVPALGPALAAPHGVKNRAPPRYFRAS